MERCRLCLIRRFVYVWSVSVLDRIKRWWVQCLTTLVTNSYIKGFLEGTIYKGKLKVVCSPGMNCYSCPGR